MLAKQCCPVNMPKSKCGRALVADRVPIVQLMFLYEARARARLVQEHQLHNWEPIWA